MPPTALIIGAGDGLGAAIARAFAADGLSVCLTRRARHLPELETLARSITETNVDKTGATAHAFAVDARDEAEMAALFDRIERDIGPLEAVIFNIGANVRHPITQTTSRVYTKVWEMAAYAGFLTGREAARVMTPRAHGTILFTGATASLRGRDGFAAFAGAKASLRALAQSLARELGPQGIHVGHIVIDGPMDGAFIRSIIPDAAARAARDELLKPEDVAANYVWLHRQKRSAWTHEIDLRPWSEPW
jgi:NAD(P)-dependent dehydrogenase (short-subunit alcohol dehydrogenase family)